jgi:hypothetical protein
LFNFVIDDTILTAQGNTENHGVTVSPILMLLDLDYAAAVACLFASINEAQEVVDSLKRSAGRYVMQFAKFCYKIG